MIIIFCPWGNATGGTELLHQLGYKLNLFGFDARMYYYGDENDLPATHPHFLKYDVPVIDTVSDNPDHFFVYPEMMVSSFSDIKNQLPLSKHILWWLSVDNAQMTSELEKAISNDTGLIHLVQSYYALNYVQKVLSVPDDRLFYLSDYLNNDFLNMDTDVPRDDTVLFNPRKGFDRTAGLIGKSDHRIKWQALAGLAPEDIPKVLQKAKVYIDFGNHPGKDRFPREAVSCGCRIITGKKGAAANDKDIPIPKELKVSDDLEDEKILDLIYGLIINYDKTDELYREYKKTISEEFHTFETDTLKVFSRITKTPIDGQKLNGEELKISIVEAVTNEDYKRALYLIAVYRLNDHKIDEDMMILEGYTRLGIGEGQEALYLMNGLLKMNDQNYEAYLIKARALISLGFGNNKEALDNAVRLSKGTADEEYISQIAEMLGSRRYE